MNEIVSKVKNQPDRFGFSLRWFRTNCWFQGFYQIKSHLYF